MEPIEDQAEPLVDFNELAHVLSLTPELLTKIFADAATGEKEKAVETLNIWEKMVSNKTEPHDAIVGTVEGTEKLTAINQQSMDLLARIFAHLDTRDNGQGADALKIWKNRIGKQLERLKTIYGLPQRTVPVNILQLPPELLAKIFAHLDINGKESAAEVHSSWRDTLLLKKLWQDCEIVLSLNQPPKKTTLATMTERCIKKVKVTTFSDHNHLREVLEGVSSLTTLKITTTDNLTDLTMLGAFATENSNLVHLDITDCTNLTDATISLLAVNLPQLERLRLRNCGLLTDAALVIIHQRMKNLTSIDLGESAHVTDEGIRTLTATAVGRAPLRELVLHRCVRLTDNALVDIGDNQSGLQTFEFWPSVAMSRHNMLSLSRVRELKRLTLHGGKEIVDDDWIPPMSTGVWKITHLTLIDCALFEDGMVGLARLSTLETLTIDISRLLSENDFRKFAERGSKIKKLVLRGNGICNDCLKHVYKLSHLVHLSLENCQLLNIRAIDNLADTLTILTKLVVTNCPRIDSTGLRLIASGLHHLRYLDLDNRMVSEAGLSLAASVMKELQSLLSGKREMIDVVRQLRLQQLTD